MSVKKLMVKDSVLGKTVVIMPERKGRQIVIELTENMSDLKIQQAIKSGVDPSHFEEAVGFEGMIKKFVVTGDTKRKLLNSRTIKTDLVTKSGFKQVERKGDETPLRTKLALAFEDFGVADIILNSTQDELEKLDKEAITKIKKVLGLRANANSETIYKALK